MGWLACEREECVEGVVVVALMVSSASVVVELGIGESFPLLLEPRPKLDRPSRLKIPGTITADPDPCTTALWMRLRFASRSSASAFRRAASSRRFFSESRSAWSSRSFSAAGFTTAASDTAPAWSGDRCPCFNALVVSSSSSNLREVARSSPARPVLHPCVAANHSAGDLYPSRFHRSAFTARAVINTRPAAARFSNAMNCFSNPGTSDTGSCATSMSARMSAASSASSPTRDESSSIEQTFCMDFTLQAPTDKQAPNRASLGSSSEKTVRRL